VQLHAACMVVAWLLLVPLGLTMATQRWACSDGEYNGCAPWLWLHLIFTAGGLAAFGYGGSPGWQGWRGWQLAAERSCPEQPHSPSCGAVCADQSCLLTMQCCHLSVLQWQPLSINLAPAHTPTPTPTHLQATTSLL
jgi:hypothetical protein